MSAGMAGVIADVLSKHRNYVRNEDFGGVICDECGWEVASKLPAVESTTVRMGQHDSHVVARELAKAGYGNVQEAKAEALTDAADWLLNGEAAGIIAFDGPSNRGEVMDAYDAAIEDPEGWLRERAAAALAIDPANLHREERDGMAEAWREGRAAAPDTLNPYEDWPSAPDPLAAALADPEGRALVKAIRDRKAEA